MTFNSGVLAPLFIGIAGLALQSGLAAAVEPSRLAAAPIASTATPASEAPPVTAAAKSAALTTPQAGAEDEPAPASAAAAPATAPPSTPAPVIFTRINLTTQTMTVSVAGETKYTWSISSGAIGYRTPTGSFRPQILSKYHRSSLYNNAPMPYSVFFNGNIATHGTTAVGHLGRPASHGCVRLQIANARTFFELVQKYGKPNVRIVVDGTTPTNGISIASTRNPRRAPAATTTSSRYSPWARQAFSAD